MLLGSLRVDGQGLDRSAFRVMLSDCPYPLRKAISPALLGALTLQMWVCSRTMFTPHCLAGPLEVNSEEC